MKQFMVAIEVATTYHTVIAAPSSAEAGSLVGDIIREGKEHTLVEAEKVISGILIRQVNLSTPKAP